jgi:hypothetical protein
MRIDAIPAGVYRFEGTYGGSLEFSVGKGRSVRFVVHEVEPTLIAPVAFKVGRAHGMSEQDFFEQVYEDIETGAEEEVVALSGLANGV